MKAGAGADGSENVDGGGDYGDSAGHGGGGGAGFVDGEFAVDDRRDGVSDPHSSTGGQNLNPGESPGEPGHSAEYITNWNGGARFGYAHGGQGGDANLISAFDAVDNINVVGGNGGSGGYYSFFDDYNESNQREFYGGDGGAGGAADLTITSDITAMKVFVLGGKGGVTQIGNNGVLGGPGGGLGGVGGEAFLTVSGWLKADSLLVESGEAGSVRGGHASFIAETLSASQISIIKREGSNVAFRVNTLDLSGKVSPDAPVYSQLSPASLSLANTKVGAVDIPAGEDGVYIGVIKLGDRQLTISQDHGVTHEYSGGHRYANIGALELTGFGTLNFTGFAVSVNDPNPPHVTIGQLVFNGGVVTADNWNIIDFRYENEEIKVAENGVTFDIALDDSRNFSKSLVGEGALTKIGPGELVLHGGEDYTGPTIVKEGTLSIAGHLASNKLTLYGGAILNNETHYTHSHSLAGGELNVIGENGIGATYKGNLIAINASLNFILPFDLDGPLLKVTGIANLSHSVLRVGLLGDKSDALRSVLTLVQVAEGKSLYADDLTLGDVKIGSTIYRHMTASVEPTSLKLLGPDEEPIDPPSPDDGPPDNPGDLPIDNGQVVVELGQVSVEKGAKALAEGFLGALALVNQGADLIALQGLEAAMSATMDKLAYSLGAFGAVSVGSIRHHTGSHVDVKGFSLMTGLAWGVDLDPGRLTLGAFFEYGNGSYDTHNSFNNAAAVDGDGDARYAGGGVLAHFNFKGSSLGRFYLEGSGRAGGIRDEYKNKDLRDAFNRIAKYDTSSPYYGFHVGLGYVFNLTESASLDVYGKYLFTREEGDEVHLSTGERLRFEDTDSSRVRIGSRLKVAVSQPVSLYVGAAYEREFSGEAKAFTNDYAIKAPSLRGGTGIGELGLALKPSETLPLVIELGVQGYTGQREGVTGNLLFKFAF
jgi:autotransporter-associated beta strand protein